MDKHNYYLVSYAWYEDYSPTLVKGPYQADWKNYCDGLLNEAVEDLIGIYGPNWQKNHIRLMELMKKIDNNESLSDKESIEYKKLHKVQLSGIGMPEIVQALIEVLKTKGYEVIHPVEATYYGSTQCNAVDTWNFDCTIIANVRGELLETIVDNNKFIHDAFNRYDED